MSETPYIGGKINGTEILYYYNGQISEKREFMLDKRLVKW